MGLYRSLCTIILAFCMWSILNVQGFPPSGNEPFFYRAVLGKKFLGGQTWRRPQRGDFVVSGRVKAQSVCGFFDLFAYHKMVIQSYHQSYCHMLFVPISIIHLHLYSIPRRASAHCVCPVFRNTWSRLPYVA